MHTKTRQGMGRKILDLPALLAMREAARRDGRTLVHAHGCFDIVHPGHIRYLQFAKQQGDLLVVSLTGDPHVGKGEGRPYVPQELRAENLAALEIVDYVYINPEPTAVALLSALRPDVYIKGREYEHNNHPGFIKEKQTVEAAGGRVMFSSGDVIYSSSHIIDQYASRLDLEQEKLALFCQRYDLSRQNLLEQMDAVVDRPYVVVGDVVLDRYQYCDASDLASDAPMMSLVPLERRDYLGGAAMVARHLASLGAEVTLIASLGTDEASDHAIDDLENLGVHMLPIRNRRKIATKTRYVVDTQKLFLVDESSATPTDTGNSRWLVDQVHKLGADEASLVLYDAGLGVLTDTLTAAVLDQRARYGRLIVGTAGSRGKLARLTNSDLIVASERALRNAMRDYEQGVSALAYRLLESARGKAFVMPLGRKGLLCFDAREDMGTDEKWEGKLRSEYVASPVNGTIDRLGYDEALLAIAGALVGVGASPQQAAYVGLAGAILEGRQSGHVPVDGHELRQMLESRPELA